MSKLFSLILSASLVTMSGCNKNPSIQDVTAKDSMIHLHTKLNSACNAVIDSFESGPVTPTDAQLKPCADDLNVCRKLYKIGYNCPDYVGYDKEGKPLAITEEETNHL